MKTLTKKKARYRYFCERCQKVIEPGADYYFTRTNRQPVRYCDGCGQDWDGAKKHFDEVHEIYNELAGMSGVNTSIALEHVFRPLAARYASGERTVELYRKMMLVE